jgi:hypothetical protein
MSEGLTSENKNMILKVADGMISSFMLHSIEWNHYVSMIIKNKSIIQEGLQKRKETTSQVKMTIWCH